MTFVSFRAASAWPPAKEMAFSSDFLGDMGGKTTQPRLCLQQPALLVQQQRPLYVTKMTAMDKKLEFKDRLRIAMKNGEFHTHAQLAKALTDFLHERRLLESNRDIPEQTIQSALSRVRDLSKYTIHFAFLCEVNPYWLAFGEGQMKIDESGKQKENSWPFRFERSRFERLTKGQQIEVAAKLEGAIVDIETKNEPVAKSNKRRMAG